MDTVKNYMNLWRNVILHRLAETFLLWSKKAEEPVLMLTGLFQTDLTVYLIAKYRHLHSIIVP